MYSEEGEPLTERKKRYNRNQGYDQTNKKGDKGKTPISGETDEKEFPKLLLQDMQDIAQEIKEMRMEKHKESPRGFLHGESFKISHHQYEKIVT